MKLTLPSSRPSRRLLGAVLLAAFAFAPEVQSAPDKKAPKTATPVTPAPSAETSPKAKLKPSLAGSSLDPSLSPSTSERTTDPGSARRRAMIALNIGHYEEAIKGFEEAYTLEQDPILLFHLAQAYRLAGQPTRALDACEAYLRSTDRSTSERGLVEQFVVEMEMIAYQIRLQRDYGLLPRSGLIPPLTSPTPASSSPLANTSNALFPASKLESSRSAELTKVPLLAPVESKPFYKRTYFWVAVGGVVAAGATAAIWYAASSHGSRAPQTGLGYQGAYQ